jgi:DNA modification methylase
MKPDYQREGITLYCADCLDALREMPDESVHCCVTSPPYWGLRDYGVDGQLGLEKTPDEYVARMVELFREVRRVLRGDGTLWVNLGDSYAGGKQGRADGDRNGVDGFRGGEKFKGTEFKQRDVPAGLKPKDLVGIPWRVAFALQADGWYLRSDIIWSKPSPMPESVTDRPTKAHEYLFLMAKSRRYYYDAEAVKEGMQECSIKRLQTGWSGNEQRGYVNGNQNHLSKYMVSEKAQASESRNRRTVWTVATQPFAEAHFATFPPKLIEPCVLAGCPEGGTVLDPFGGSGTTGLVALSLNRKAILIELNPAYCEMIQRRLAPMANQTDLFRKEQS